MIETELVRKGDVGKVSLFGSLDVAHTLSGSETTMLVSGEELRSKAPSTGVHVGVGGTWRWDHLSLHSAIRAHGAGSGDTEYIGRLGFRGTF